ncbi:MAG: anthranilate synthase component I family protein [bacterium]
MIIQPLNYYPDPLQVASHLADRPDFAFLDSSDHQHGLARYSLIALEPFLKFSWHKGKSHLSCPGHICEDPSGISCQGQGGESPVFSGDPLDRTSWIDQFKVAASEGDPFRTLRELINRFRVPLPSSPSSPPLSHQGSLDSLLPLGAAIGYISYDFGASWEAGIPPLQGFEDWPQMEWRFYDTLLVFDHRRRILTLVSTGFPFLGAMQDRWAHERFSHFLSLLEKIPAKDAQHYEEQIFAGNFFPSCSNTGGHVLITPSEVTFGVASGGGTGDLAGDFSRRSQKVFSGAASENISDGASGSSFWNLSAKTDLRSNFTSSTYQKAVGTIKDYIARGDVYQVNLSQQFSTETTEEGFDLYRKIRKINRVPYGGYLRFEQREILCFSMERFLRMEGDRVQTRPIKGTVPRGRTEQEDLILAKQLWQSEKDQAELLMVVDMERNDLAKVCALNSVCVDQLFEVEKYATVFHLVSTVSGRLRPGIDHLECLRACFPGGSITGTPKIRAMQIIAELENVRRSVYCGALGYFGFNQVSDFNIPIRTILKQGPNIWFNAGGGVVTDSSPYLEYMETLHKVRSFLACIQSSACPDA